MVRLKVWSKQGTKHLNFGFSPNQTKKGRKVLLVVEVYGTQLFAHMLSLSVANSKQIAVLLKKMEGL